MIHYISKDVKESYNIVTIEVIGVGGTGSMIITRLARLNYAMIALGMNPIHVIAYDPKNVRHSNIGRQAFTPSDIGYNKAETMINKVNKAYGFHWMSRPKKVYLFQSDISIICIDSAKERNSLIEGFKAESNVNTIYILDVGNMLDYGNIFLYSKEVNQPTNGIPTLEHEITHNVENDITQDEEGCSTYQLSLNQQSLFINDWASLLAIDIIQTLLTKEYIEYKGCYFNSKNGKINKILL